ncbi:unnamed protein product [Closterium sp. Yama58-4]|nr:unnamed protein product [Closterium sp. Yama58-4]
MVRSGATVLMLVRRMAAWTPTRSLAAMRELADVMGMGSTTVNFATATAPFMDVLERLALNVPSVPRSMCYGTWRLVPRLYRPNEHMPREPAMDEAMNRARVRVIGGTARVMPAPVQIPAPVGTIVTGPLPGTSQGDNDSDGTPDTPGIESDGDPLSDDDDQDEDGDYNGLGRSARQPRPWSLPMIGFRPCPEIVPELMAPSRRLGSLVRRPLSIGLLPSYWWQEHMSKAEVILSKVLTPERLRLVMWTVGNGLLDPIARPRILYLYGPKGGEGKSTALQVLASQLPGCYRPLSRNYPGTASNLPEDEKARLMDYRFTSHGDVVLKDGRVNATFWKEVCGGDLVSVSGGVGVLDLTVLLASNDIWFPHMTRRTFVILLDKTALDLPRPDMAFSDRDVFEFTCACIGTRLKSEEPPVTAECVLLTIFGKRAGIVTRAVRLAEPETFDQALVASYSIAMLRGHVAGGGTYVQVQKDSPPTMTAASVLGPTLQNDDPLIALILAEERDVTKSTSAAGPLEFTDVYVLWPDGGISPSLILQSVVVEYRTNIGQAKQYKSDRGDRTWSGTYMESYASLGIPAARYQWLMDSIRACVPMPVDELTATMNDGYAWVNAKLPDKVGLRMTMRVNQVTKQLSNAVTALSSIRSNVSGIGTVTIKLRRIPDEHRNRGRHYAVTLMLHAMQILSVDHASVAVKCTREFIESVKRIVGPDVNTSPLSYLALIPESLPLKHVVIAEGPYPSHRLPALASAFAYVAPDSSMTVSSQILSQALCMSIDWEELELCQNLVKRSHGLRNVGIIMVNCRMALDDSVCVNVALESLFSKWLMQMLIVSQAMNPDTVRLYSFGTPARKAVNAALQHMTTLQRTAVRCQVIGLKHPAWLSRACRSSSDIAMASGNVNVPAASTSAAGRGQGTSQAQGRGHRQAPVGEAGSYAMGLVQEAANTCRQLRDKSEAAIARLLVAIKSLEDEDRDAIEACITELSNTNSSLANSPCPTANPPAPYPSHPHTSPPSYLPPMSAAQASTSPLSLRLSRLKSVHPTPHLTSFVPPKSAAQTGSSPLSLRQRVGIAVGVLRALKAMQSHGQVHGDLKPSNVLLTVAWEVSAFFEMCALPSHTLFGWHAMPY